LESDLYLFAAHRNVFEEYENWGLKCWTLDVAESTKMLRMKSSDVKNLNA